MDATRDCNFYQEQLSAYIDDELGRSERRSLDAHLAACAVCTASLARLRSVVAQLKGMPRMQTGPDYLIALRRRIDRGDARGEGLLESIDWFRVNFALGAATLGVVALVMFRSPAWQDEARWLPVPGAGQVISDAAAPVAASPAEHVAQARKSLEKADAAAASFAGKTAPAPAVAIAPPRAAQVAVADESSLEAEAAPRKERARAVTPAADRKKSAPVAMAAKPAAPAPAPAASPAAPIDSGPLARAGGAGSMGLGAGGAPTPVDLGGAFASPERDVVRDGMSTGLNVGALTPAGPATDRDPVLNRALAQAPAEEKASAQEDSFSKAEESAPGASAAGSPLPPAPEPQAVPAGAVTHEVLVQYLGSRVVSGSAQAPAKDKGEATILVKTTQLSAFLRTLREKADELKVSDAVATSGATFEFSLRGRGGKEGLEALAARLSAFPGAQPAGLMFEKVPDAGDYTCRVLVAVE